MIENGYIRKIDELGRVVIPKELRKKMKIQDGDNLVINGSNKGIQLSKQSYIKNYINFISLVGDKTKLLTGFNIIITDQNRIVYSSESYRNSQIENIKNYVDSRESILLSNINLNKDIKINGHICIEPIISNSMCLGLVILYTNEHSDFLAKTAKLIANIISIQIDIS